MILISGTNKIIFQFLGLLFLLSALPVYSAANEKNGLIYFYGYPFNSESEIIQISKIPGIKRAEISIEWKDVFIDRNHFNWDFIDKHIKIWEEQGKTVILRFMTANNSTYSTSSELIDQERIRLVGEGIFSDFENDIHNDGYKLINAEIVSSNFSGSGMKSVELKENYESRTTLIQTTDEVRFEADATYLVQFDYKIIQLIDKKSQGRFRITFKSMSNDTEIFSESFEVTKGDVSLFTKEIRLHGDHGYFMTVEAENISHGLIDNINIIHSSDSRGKRVAFPDYFSASFKVAYTRFMIELAKKYRNNPVVDAIVVGGIGRWEEMLLNANEEGIKDVQESIFRQWRAYGYTDVNYLKNVVEWSIDLSKKYFPDKEHILQISPLNNGYENEDFIYRRAASIAVSKGVSIKQNGMSEKYDTWESASDPAFIMNRYRYNKNVKRYYETGAQIYNNGLNAMGHPLSLFNRVAIDGVKSLYLYKSDILEPNVQKYFSYFDSIIQKPLISLLYSTLGEYPLANRKKRMPHLFDTIMYHNNWLGIRQYNDHGANVDYTIDEKTHRKGVRTNAYNSKILFDIDDRVMYNGMSNPILTIEYLDFKTDTFKVYVLDRITDKLIKIDEIVKNNSGKFNLKSIPLGRYFDAFDNHREVKPEIIIDDNKDGFEFISSLEIEFVPVNDFIMMLVSECKPTRHALLLKNISDSIQRHLFLTIDRPVSKAELVYCDTDFNQKSNIYASLKLVNNGQTTEVSEKQYYIGGDKEILTLPVASNLIPQQAILTLFSGKGRIGAYRARDGELAYRLFCFENQKITDFVFEKGSLQVNGFLNGFEFSPDVDIKNIEIKKILPDLSEMSIDYSVSENILYFQPQAPGTYRILVNNKTIKPISICGLVER